LAAATCTYSAAAWRPSAPSRASVSRTAQALVYANLAREIQVSVDTAKRWVDLLARMHDGFIVQPWFKNVAKSLRKEPRWFLLKAVEGWTDLGFGDFELRYLRDKQKREVDFLVEAKLGDTRLSPSLGHFQGQTKAPHAFQVVMNARFEPADCFAIHRPVVVPAKTFLSQLL
jgi:hypothetical protein